LLKIEVAETSSCVRKATTSSRILTVNMLVGAIRTPIVFGIIGRDMQVGRKNEDDVIKCISFGGHRDDQRAGLADC
jgi:hypothetical protein